MNQLSTEAAILHAVIDGDLDEARRRIADMLPGERHALADQAHKVADLIAERDQLMELVKRKCRWLRSCGTSPIGYYTYRGQPWGICEEHRPEAIADGIPVLDLPKEVQL